MTLGGCLKTVSGSFSGSAEQATASATPAGECKRVAKPVGEPPMREGEDARHVIQRFRARLGLANKRIVESNGCSDTAADRVAR
jgi:hypothetical protein